MTNYVRSLRLQALTGQNLAEILMPEKVEDDPILLMPTMGMYFEAQMNRAQPHVITGPHRKHSAGFLAYLADIAAAAEPGRPDLAMHLTGESPAKQYCDITLTRHIQAGELAEITGLSPERVRKYLANHLTFPAVPK